MIYLLVTLAILAQALLLIAIVVLGIWLIRRTQLRSVPWLMAYVLLPEVLSWVGLIWLNQQDTGERIARAFAAFAKYSEQTIGALVVMMTYFNQATTFIAAALAIWMLGADIGANVIANDVGAARRATRLITWPHRHMVICGIALLALVVIKPVAVMLVGVL